MSIDFRADQIRTNRLIATGSTGTNAKILIYPVDAAANLSGDIDLTKFTTGSIGTDIFMFVSGAINSLDSSTPGVSVFGGDVHVSGNLRIQGSLIGASVGSSQWLEGTPSPRIRTTASVAISADSLFAEDYNPNAFFVVSGSVDGDYIGDYYNGFEPEKSALFGGGVIISGNLGVKNGIALGRPEVGNVGPSIYAQWFDTTWRSFLQMAGSGFDMGDGASKWRFQATRSFPERYETPSYDFGGWEPTGGGGSQFYSWFQIRSGMSGSSEFLRHGGELVLGQESGKRIGSDSFGRYGRAIPFVIHGSDVSPGDGSIFDNIDVMGVPVILRAGLGTGMGTGSYVTIRAGRRGTVSTGSVQLETNIATFWHDSRLQIYGNASSSITGATPAGTGSFYFANNVGKLYFQNTTSSYTNLINPYGILNETVLMFSSGATQNVGSDVFFYVSGSSGSIGTAIRGVSVFGGDVVVSGTLKIGSSSIQILGNQNMIQFDPTVTIFKSSSQLYFTDASNLSPISLTSLNSSATAASWIEGTPSPRIRTTASVKIGSGTGFAQDAGSDVFFYVSGSRQRTLDGTFLTSFPTDGLAVFQGATYHSGGIYIRHEGVTGGTGSLCFLWANSSQQKPLIQILAPNGTADSAFDGLRHDYGSVIYGSYNLTWNSLTIVRGGNLQLEGRSSVSGNPDAAFYINEGGGSGGFGWYMRDGVSNQLIGVGSIKTYTEPKFSLGSVYGTGNANHRDAFIAGTDHPGGGFGNDNGVSLNFRPGYGTGLGLSFLRFHAVVTQSSGGTIQTYQPVLDIYQYGLKFKPLPESYRPKTPSITYTGSLYASDNSRLYYYPDSTSVKEVYISAKSPYSSSLLTTNATPSLLQSISLSLGIVYNVDATVIAKQQDNLNRGRWIKNLLVYNSGGIAVIDGDIVYDIAPDRVSTGSWGMNFEVSGSNLRLFVTGAISTAVTWSVNADLIPA